MPEDAARATYRAPGDDLPQARASAAVRPMASEAAAVAEVARARSTFGTCSGSFTVPGVGETFPGKVLGVDALDIGEGGFAIRDQIDFGDEVPEAGYTAIFSVGPYVVQIDQWTGGDAKDVARAIAEGSGS